jgi:sensor c-di-GMP phosphodiesterase-like protein
MNRATKHRILIGRFVMIALAACGMAAGYALGCGIALIQAGDWLEHSSEAITVHENAALAEASGMLHAMQSSRSGFCSETEIANFRTLVFRSEYVKDAGRIRGGNILCSATSGRPEKVIGPFKSDFRQEDGTVVYHNLSPMQIDGMKRAALQLGNAYVVFGMGLPPEPNPIPTNLAITMKASEIRGPKFAPTTTATDSPVYMTAEGRGWVGDTLYVTSCSNLNFDCVTATTTVSQAIHGQPDLVYSSAIAGAMAGILCGLGITFLFSRRRELSHQLRRAVEREELDVLYQPIVNLATGEVVAAEALARWTDEDGNAVDPEVFVKIAEDHRFVTSITKLVLKRILRDFGATLQNRPAFKVSLNVAAHDLLDPDFLPMLEGSLQRAKLRPESLAIEITERSTTNDEAAMETIRNLKRLGHGIHVDDFGAGYSNLDILLSLYCDTIKMDKAFTKLIGTGSVATVILPQIMSLAKSMNLGVVVEGLETTQQVDYFSPGTQEIYGQGWLYGRPMPAEAFLSQLSGSRVAAHATPEEIGALSAKPGGLYVTA